MIVRLATKNDLENYIALDAVAFRDGRVMRLTSTSLFNYQRKEGFILIAEDGNALLGFCGVVFSDKNTFYVTNLAVSEQYRRLGIGTSLISKVIHMFAGTNKVCRIVCNDISKKIVVKLGFNATGDNSYEICL